MLAAVAIVFVCYMTTSYALLSDVHVMVNGLPGPMAVASAISCLDRGFQLVPIGFTGNTYHNKDCVITGSTQSQSVQLLKGPGLNPDAAATLKQIKMLYPNLIIVDYTHPSATVGNVQCYQDCLCDFVMGTTGGDPSIISKILDVEESKRVAAVIAPNMGKQIVAMQAALLEMSQRFPGSFQGYTLEVTESHQSSKADTSGTAKAVVASLGVLNGETFKVEDIVKLRDRESQLKFGVPEEGLDGHAFHTYKFTSPDKSVEFELKHNVVGRKVYAEGTADAVSFVDKVRSMPGGKRVYNMIDVLESKML